MTDMVITPIAQDATLGKLCERLTRRGGAMFVSGLWGSSAPLVVATATATTQRTFLYVTAHLQEADDALDDLELFSSDPEGPSVAIYLLPAWESDNGGSGGGEIHAERLRLCNHLAGPPGEPGIVVAPIQALMQPVPSPEALRKNTLRLSVGQRCEPSDAIAWLTDRGFERLDRVESPGDLAVRGDILDVFAPGDAAPVRVVFLDDAIESIRRFDVSTQRSDEMLATVSVPAPLRHQTPAALDQGTTSFLDYLPEDAVIVLDDPLEIEEMGRTFVARVSGADAQALEPIADVLARVARFDYVQVSRLGGDSAGGGNDAFAFDVASLSRLEGKPAEVVAELCRVAADHQVYVVCANEAERERLTEIVTDHVGRVPPSMHMPVATKGDLHRGFEWTPAGVVCVAHHELFQRYQQRRRIRRVHAARPLDTWLELEPGDLVVHASHGIAKFVGMRTLTKGTVDEREEFLTLEFAGHAKLHVPVSQVDLLQKYIGTVGMRPKLSTLGGTRWRKTTERVADAAADFAASLLAVQAAREANPGIAYPADTSWQREFEGSFPFEETEDQVTGARDVKNDLSRARPMDRLLCGDVGYGKTEIAIRAAFKVVEFGKQVAVLVPTTVLAEQHFQTLTERLADFPFEVRCLSRFRSPSEQRRIVEDAKKGRVDILIGTHRLLSKDVGFADLGLVVIDEEQRFGVEHKDRLRQLRHTVDVLTMTATPIPRTLHMAMLGIRDISSLATPPLDRRAIATQIRPFEPRLIRQAVLREMNREGQVYFVHNRVHSIQAMADEVRRIVPEARVVVGHGQMKEGQLEKVMAEFVHHQADVLVATTIIENGLDIPRVNTIFINQADRFGLADLHQLRGRVGRSKHRAYCYLLLPPNRPVTPKAARRLKSIEEFSELGAGFRIAMRDLEIRGAGNILGPEQSGHIGAVGYEMYCQILERAVRRLQGQPDTDLGRVDLELEISGHVPAEYIASPRARIDVYKRIVSSPTIADLQQVERDLTDAFGVFPPAVGRLLELAEVRIRARDWGIRSVVLKRPDVVFTVDDHRRLEPVFTDAPGTARMPDAKTIHWRLPPQYLEGPTLLALLRRRLAPRTEVPV